MGKDTDTGQVTRLAARRTFPRHSVGDGSRKAVGPKDLNPYFFKKQYKKATLIAKKYCHEIDAILV